MSSVKAVAPFETKIGSIADTNGARLTAHAGFGALPEKLAMCAIWNQLSLHRDDSRLVP